MNLSTWLQPIRRFVSEGKRLPIYLGIFSTCFVLWLQLNPPTVIASIIERLEFLVYDQRLSIMPKHVKSPDNRIVIVDLDERSLQAEGQYPWNRIKVGQLTEKLRDNGVLVVGFDITFPEPDRNIRDLLQTVDLSQFDPGFNETLAQIEPRINADQYFARAMQSGIDVVLAINFTTQSTAAYNELPESLVDIGAELAEDVTVSDMTGYTGNIEVLQSAAYGNGSMNQVPDSDGVVRRVPLLIRYGSELFPTLSLEMVRVYNFAESYELITEDYDGLKVVRGVGVGVGAGRFEIPTDGFAKVTVPYIGPSSEFDDSSFPYISATDVLRDTLSEEEKSQLQNSLVLVGTSAPGLGDIRAMPLDIVYPGVEVHANMLNALLDSVATVEVESGDASTESAFSGFTPPTNIYFPYRPDWTGGALFVGLTALGLLMSMIFPLMGAASMAVTGAVLVTGTVWGNFQMWDIYKLDFPLVLILILILLVTMTNLIYGFLSESQTRKTIKGMFDQYVPPAHIDSMLDDPDNYSFEGESKDLSVLFCDIRNFTTISEALSATELKKLMNDFFTPITKIIFDNNGTIDKYVGDMVMAFWGAPLEDLNHRENAIRAALIMLEKVDELRPVFLERGYPEIAIGIGVNSGMMNVGDMGSVYRRSYTVLGDAVNLSSRLEGLTKFYGIKLLVGEAAIKDLDGFLFRLIDRVKVKGKIKAVDCYEPICVLNKADAELQERVSEYHKALDCYFAQDWPGAESILKALQQGEPDTLLYKVYLERIETLKEEVLPKDWDGSFTHTSK
ncbi:MAG: adenylate/guanylate cyclase domain-containing protein [SAR86 cluster bacterium]|uniref:Adenylate/guanylate cyclase domain-containing protein n=1 Tax=SAR86 cluster bacterium TaxID=2030880 RepID=A0A2A4WVZ2_9GAMM|nr:MAG: adenylate/guanylate cyclase domain-containing protein [SAR86 cluster bacterium]